MSKIVKKVATLVALLSKSADAMKLVQKFDGPVEYNLVQSGFLTLSEADAIDLDDEPGVIKDAIAKAAAE